MLVNFSVNGFVLNTTDSATCHDVDEVRVTIDLRCFPTDFRSIFAVF